MMTKIVMENAVRIFVVSKANETLLQKNIEFFLQNMRKKCNFVSYMGREIVHYAK